MEFKTTIIGRVGQDADLRETPNGKKVCNYSVATNPERDKTVWVRVTTWNRQAELDGQYVKKGMIVKCEGILQSDDNGKPRTYEKDGTTYPANFELTSFNTKYITWGDKDNQSDGGSINTAEEIPF